MANVYTLGLAKIEIGDIASDGGMGATLSVIGYTYQGTCTMTTEEAETTDHYAEEMDDPVVSVSRAGKTTFSFSIMNPDVTVLKQFLGGTISGTGDTAKWNAPNLMPAIEKSVRITPQQGLMFDIPRLKITAKINGPFSKTEMFLLEVTGTVLMPEKSGTYKLIATKITAA
jgi:hypothetical protein